MKTAIVRRASELGFDTCRFTTADPPESGLHFERWLTHQLHGEMEYLKRNEPKRIDPRRVLPGARTIICLAASYHQSAFENEGLATRTNSTGAELASRPATTGVVARYARYGDYHKIIGTRLELLTAFVNELGGPETRSLWYVDTGPVLERDLAQRAGLGFIGKHTNLISRILGNWFLLGEILTTIELTPDAAEVNRCGSCSRCLAACPTRAIVAPFQLDARRCISYLTIELKGAIPVEFRAAIGNRIFGCDDCLAACPWNRFAREGRLMKEHSRPDLSTPDLLRLLELTETEFKERFAGTPLLRTKRKGLLRNVCVALGNIGNRDVLPALERAQLDPEPLIREHSQWAIEQIHLREKKQAAPP